MTVDDPGSAEFFDDLYRRASDTDPWQFENSPYEQRRYRTLLKLLEGQRFHRALEPGCSIGVWSRMLSDRCDELIAVDFSSQAVGEAVARTQAAGITNITFQVASFPGMLDQLVSTFDLLCLVEIGYYFEALQWSRAVHLSLDVVSNDATVLLSHWDGSSQDHRLGPETVHDVATDELQRSGFVPLTQRERHEGFIAELWRRC